jgi:CDGSH-type Zn-finger protein
LKKTPQGADDKTPMIVFTPYSPYMVVDVDRLTGADGRELPLAPVTALCRCGASGSKPYCDGSHARIGFVGKRERSAPAGRSRSYAGKHITIHDNRRACAHSAECLQGLPAVFRKDGKPWIDPDAATAEEIIRVIESCPSGALSYTVHGELHQEWSDGPPAIKVDKGGPLRCTGCIALKDADGAAPAAASHYTLCRCGKSANKPFCDGTHWKERFK